MPVLPCAGWKAFHCPWLACEGDQLLKPALRLMIFYRLVIEEVKDAEVITSYTWWVAAVQMRGTPSSRNHGAQERGQRFREFISRARWV
jgi:hypothetical protein